MNLSNDWLMRQIANLGDGLQQLLKKDDRATIPQPTNAIADDEILSEILNGLVESGQIDEAENLLFRCIENYPLVENYKIGLDFYKSLILLDEKELNNAGWSKEEIKDGLNDLHIIIFDEPMSVDEGANI